MRYRMMITGALLLAVCFGTLTVGGQQQQRRRAHQGSGGQTHPRDTDATGRRLL